LKQVYCIFRGNTSWERNRCIIAECQKIATVSVPIWVFRDKIWQKLNTEISWTLRQISNFNRRPFYRILKRRVHQKSLSRQSEKITHNKLYCFIDWINWQWSFSVILFAYKQKKKIAHRLHSLFLLRCLNCHFKNSGMVPCNIYTWKGVSHERKFENNKAR
jgi:hypothetical protein